jgi:hypothetical protein
MIDCLLAYSESATTRYRSYRRERGNGLYADIVLHFNLTQFMTAHKRRALLDTKPHRLTVMSGSFHGWHPTHYSISWSTRVFQERFQILLVLDATREVETRTDHE